MKTLPKSIMTGPAYIFFNSSPIKSILISLISLCVDGFGGNFLRTGYNESGLNIPLSFIYDGGSYLSIGLVTYNPSLFGGNGNSGSIKPV